MKKLKQFNKLYNKIIFESANINQEQKIRDYKLFFTKYIQPIAEKCNVLAQINRYNTFRVTGIITDVYNFFNNFKVDKTFNESQEQLYILSPLVTFGQIKHFYNNGKYNPIFNRTFSEGNQLIDAINSQLTTRAVDDIAQNKIQGRWYVLYNNTEKNQEVPDFNIPKQLRKCTSKELLLALKDFIKIMSANEKEDTICVEFIINCDKIMNSYDNDTKAIKVTFAGKDKKILDVADKMNDEDKLEKPSVITTLTSTEDSSLVGDTKQIIRQNKVINYNKKNKTTIKSKANT